MTTHVRVLSRFMTLMQLLLCVFQWHYLQRGLVQTGATHAISWPVDRAGRGAAALGCVCVSMALQHLCGGGQQILLKPHLANNYFRKCKDANEGVSLHPSFYQ